MMSIYVAGREKQCREKQTDTQTNRDRDWHTLRQKKREREGDRKRRSQTRGDTSIKGDRQARRHADYQHMGERKR